MVATVVTQLSPAGSREMLTSCVFRTTGDLAGLLWDSTDTHSHPYYQYGTNLDYSTTVWQFDFAITNLIPIDQLNGLTLTVTHSDSSQNFIRLYNYLIAGGPTAGTIRLPFASVMGGFNATNPVDWTNITEMQISLVPTNYASGGTTPIVPPAGEASLLMSNFEVSGPALTQDRTQVPAHDVRMTDDFDDSGTLTPERILTQIYWLGYRYWYNLYLGTGHHHQLAWSSSEGRFVVDPTQPPVNAASRAWLTSCFAQCSALGFVSVIISQSLEILQTTIPLAWRQMDYSGAPALTGYTPPSALISPSVTAALDYIVAVFNWCNGAILGAGLAPYSQLGEWWWWDQSFSTHAPCFYDSATMAAYPAETGHPVPTPHLTNTSQSIVGYEAFLNWLGGKLGNAGFYVSSAVKAAHSGVRTSFLIYTPQVLSTPMLSIVNQPAVWSFPTFDLCQLEDYEFITDGNAAGHQQTWAVGASTFGYSYADTTYFSGYVQNAADAATFWPLIFDAVLDGEQHAGETYLWARPEIFRDGVIWECQPQPAIGEPPPATSPSSPLAGYATYAWRLEARPRFPETGPNRPPITWLAWYALNPPEFTETVVDFDFANVINGAAGEMIVSAQAGTGFTDELMPSPTINSYGKVRVLIPLSQLQSTDFYGVTCNVVTNFQQALSAKASLIFNVSGVEEAPPSGEIFARCDGEWVPLAELSVDNGFY